MKKILIAVVLAVIFAAGKSHAAIGDIWCAGTSTYGWCINATGAFIPQASGTLSLGSAAYPIANIYAAAVTATGTQTYTGNVYFGAANYKSTMTASNGNWAITGAVSVAGALTGATLNTGQGAYELYKMDQNVSTDASPAFVNPAATGQLKLASKTSAEIGALVPAQEKFALVGNSDTGELCLSTGTAAGAWVKASSVSTACY